MTFTLSLATCDMSAISDARKAFKEHTKVDVQKNQGTVSLDFQVNQKYGPEEKQQVIGSFLNYVLQATAINKVGIEHG